MGLAEGKRSYALSKRLHNTQNPIYEAKLGGQRILWTKLKRGDMLSILVCLDCLCSCNKEKYISALFVCLRLLNTCFAGMVCQPS